LELMKDDLYFDLARNANQQAMKIKKALSERGVQFLSDTSTNQIFPILSNKIIEVLSEKFEFYIWKKIDENLSAIRLITSWNTQNEPVEEFIKTFNSEL